MNVFISTMQMAYFERWEMARTKQKEITDETQLGEVNN